MSLVRRVGTTRWFRAAADDNCVSSFTHWRTGVVDSVPKVAMNSTVEGSQVRLDEFLNASLAATIVRTGA